MKRMLHVLFLFVLVNAITAQPLDWNGDVVVFGSAQEEHQPRVTAMNSDVLHAFCMIDDDSIAVKRSGIGGSAWSAVNKISVPFAGTRITCAQDNTYSYVFVYSTLSALKQLHRFGVTANEWDEAFYRDIPTGFGGTVDEFAATTDRVIQPDDPYLNMCWIEGIGEGNMSIGFIQSRDQGSSLEEASLVYSTSSVPQTPAGLTTAMTWNGDAETIHVGTTRDRAGSTPDEVILFRSTNQGLSWTNALAPDASTYPQKQPSLGGHANTLFLAYACRSDVTAQRDIYFTYSPDGGATFNEPMQITDSDLDEFAPRIAVNESGDFFHVFFLSCEVLSDTSTLMVISGSVTEPWEFGEAVPVSPAGVVWNAGDYAVTSGPAGVAAVWTTRFDLGDMDVYFDAAWRGNPAEGFGELIPSEISLSSCYPNPFNGVTNVSLSLSRPQEVTLTITDVLGRQVDHMSIGAMTAGEHRVHLDFTGYATGNYWLNLAGASSPPLRITLMR